MVWSKGSNSITLNVYIQDVSAPFFERSILSLLYILGTLVENELTMNVSVYFWAVNFIPLRYIPLCQVPHSLDCCSFIVSFEIGKCEKKEKKEIGKCEFSNFVALFKNCFCYVILIFPNSVFVHIIPLFKNF